MCVEQEFWDGAHVMILKPELDPVIGFEEDNDALMISIKNHDYKTAKYLFENKIFIDYVS